MKRRDVLKEFDIKEISGGRPNVFSIKFRTKHSGELIFFPKAISVGLKMDMSANRMRGVLAVDDNYKKIGHPTPVSIDRIVEFNGEKVYL